MSESPPPGMRGFQRMVLGIFGMVALTIAGLVAGTWKIAAEAANAAQWVHHTYEVLDGLARVQQDTLRIELATQNYRISGDPARLTERDALVRAREETIARVGAQTRDNPRQQARLDRLRTVVAERLAISHRVEELRKTLGAEAATAYAQAAPLPQTRQRTAAILLEMEAEERGLLGERLAQRQAGERLVFTAGLASAFGVVVLLAAAYAFIRRRLLESQGRLQAYQSGLEALVRERTAELELANRELQVLFEHAPVGILVSRQRQVVSCNRKWEALLGYGPGELEGQSTRPWYTTRETFETTGAEIRAALADRQVVFREMPLVRKDGTQGWFRFWVQALQPVDGGELVLTIMEDASREHEAMQRLEEQKAQAIAESAAKGSFLANISHEIRTPLNAITGMAQLMRRRGLDDEQRGRLDKIEAAADHLLSVVNDVLDLSKIDAGKFVLDDQPLQVGAVIGNVVSMLQDRASTRHLELRSELPALPRNLCGDATRVQQCLLNYASNAIKFTERGRVVLRAALESLDDEGARVRFEVEDTGPGIAPADLERLFAAFEQADNSLTRRHGGTGLGLAITRKLARLMGGDAGARSTPGQGSTFWFTVRLRRQAAAAAAAAARAWEDGEEALRAQCAGARVLLADDDPINRELTSIRLKEAGLAVDLACDGQEAVERAGTGHYDLILMDMQMPRLDGLEATRRIRALPGLATTPVVAMTANAFSEDRNRCLDAGMNDFIPKPCKPEQFYGTVLAWLKKA